ncbi:MAG: hypothetical protein HN522_00380, partial [Flavobacteriales bacterium]|nr:hypothetical protein [Flavobacteriales bacterium]
TKDGLFQMIPWDLDNTFSGAIMGFDYFNQSNIYEYDPYHDGSPNSPAARPLAEKLFNDPFYRKIYTAHINTIIEESLDTSMIRSNIDNLQNLAYNAANQDNNKGFSMTDYYENVNNAIWTNWGFGGILSTINERKQFLLNHPEISLVPPTIKNVMINTNLLTAEVSNANSVELMATTSEYNSKFQSFIMLDDGTNGDVVSNDGIYSVVLPFQSIGLEVKFYIRSENDDAIKLNPQRAEYELYTYSATTSILEATFTEAPVLIKITDILGRTIAPRHNTPLFYIYSDGSVEKRFIVK